MMAGIKRGSIWTVTLEPVRGREIGKTRPAVVISNDINNEYAETVTVIPVTSSTSKVYPFEVYLPKGDGKLTRNSKAKCNQIRTIDKKRLIKLIGVLSENKIHKIEEAILIHLQIRL